MVKKIIQVKSLKIYLVIAILAAIGSILRSCLAKEINGVLLVNILGCIALGFINLFLKDYNYSNLSLAKGLTVGFIGSFTTFSSYNLELFKLINHKQYLAGLTYFILFAGLGLFFTWIGMLLEKIVVKVGKNR
ncbi:MAG: CrcB family protein [Lactobacillus iners]|nr:CrcB family protein [Lactobacillus iners]MCT7866131.1 CrcB family protein [Lactobacillus iners]